jgi:hypothetical protein
MTYKMYAAFIASLGVALTLTSNGTFGASSAMRGGKSASTHSTSHPSVARSPHQRRGRHSGAYWPTAGGFFYGQTNGEPEINVTEPTPGNTRYTCTLDIPWDWVHRCPPFENPSPPPAPVFIPSVPGCPAHTTTVMMGNGKEQTVTIVRCP